MMKSRTQIRLECLKMAAGLAISKVVSPKTVVATATEYFKWVEDSPEELPRESAFQGAMESLMAESGLGYPEALADLHKRMGHKT